MNQSACPAAVTDAPPVVSMAPPVRILALNRFGWPLLSLLLAMLVLFVLPGRRILLGESQLKGLVGSYTGHGNWLITVSYTGTGNWQLTHSPVVQYGELWEWVNGQSYPETNVDLSTISQIITNSGGASSAVDIKTWLGTMNGSAQVQFNLSSASIVYNLTWSPSIDNITEPCPNKHFYVPMIIRMIKQIRA